AAAINRMRSQGSSCLYRTATPMCVEVVKSIALKPTRSMTGAMVSVRAVSTPSAAQTHWLPSRSDVSMSWTSAKPGLHEHRCALEQPAQESRVHTALLKLPVGEHRRMQRQVGSHTLYPGGGDGPPHALERCVAVFSMNDDLRHQRVIERRDARS